MRLEEQIRTKLTETGFIAHLNPENFVETQKTIFLLPEYLKKGFSDDAKLILLPETKFITFGKDCKGRDVYHVKFGNGDSRSEFAYDQNKNKPTLTLNTALTKFMYWCLIGNLYQAENPDQLNDFLNT